jgi:hypothetical protein
MEYLTDRWVSVGVESQAYAPSLDFEDVGMKNRRNYTKY